MKKVILSILLLSLFHLVSCGDDKAKEKVPTPAVDKKQAVEEVDPMKDKGIGPVTSVTLGEIDEALVTKGKEVFKAKCTACHKINKKYIGPALKGVTQRQSPEWIMNMILNPEVMIAKNKTAKELLKEFSAPMANQHLTEEEARAVLEYFRTKN